MYTYTSMMFMLLFLASFSKGAAIGTTSAAHIKFKHIISASIAETPLIDSIKEENSVLKEYDTETNSKEDFGQIDSIGIDVEQDGMPLPYETKKIEYGKDPNTANEFTGSKIPEDVKTILGTISYSSSQCCSFTPVETEQEHIGAIKIPDSLTVHLAEVEAKQRDTLGLNNYSSSVSHIPEGCYSKLSETEGRNVIYCSGKNISNIPFFEIRKVPELVFFNTSITAISIEATDNLPRAIVKLNFTNGLIRTVRGTNIKYIEDLETLSLHKNALTGWSFSMVFDDDGNRDHENSIKYLDLSNNFINFPPDPYGTSEVIMPNLETLGLNNNPICYLPDKLFEPLKNCPMKRLYMKNCCLVDFKGDPLQHFPNLEVLDLSQNPKMTSEKVTALLVPLQGGILRELYLAQNPYDSVPTAALSMVNETLEMLDLHLNSFRTLENTSFPIMPKLRTLRLMYCRIHTIEENTFQVMPVLEELYLDGNYLLSFTTALLLPSLQILSLTENPSHMTGETPQVFSMDDVDLSQLENLKELSLDNVRLIQLKNNHFDGLQKLRSLSLKNSLIRSIEPYSFRNLANLETLNLEGNLLSVLENKTFIGLTNLTTLNLKGNSISFYSLDILFPNKLNKRNGVTSVHKSLKGKDTENHHEKEQFPSYSYSSNSLIDNQKIYPAAAYHVLEEETKQGSYKPSQNDDDLGKEAIPYFPFEGLDRLENLKLSYNQIRRLSPQIFNDLVNLKNLLISNNHIMQWYDPIFQNTTKLSHLYLRNNAITTLTDAMVKDLKLQNLEFIDIEDNELVCNCSLRKFNDTLSRSKFFNFPNYICEKGYKYYNVSSYLETLDCSDPPSEQENKTSTWLDVKLIIVGLVVTPVVIASISVFIYKKRWYIRYIKHSLRNGIKAFRVDDDNHTYDTFLCYSNSDKQWVFEHLLPKLEDVAKYRVCVHERDFTVGQEITDNIIESVEKSRKVIVVLTPAFVASSWCMFELQMASCKILDEKKSKLIVVLLEDIPKQSQPKKLRLLLKTRTYIEWKKEDDQQNAFWNRLFRAIAKPPEKEETLTTISSSIDKPIEYSSPDMANDYIFDPQFQSLSEDEYFSEL